MALTGETIWLAAPAGRSEAYRYWHAQLFERVFPALLEVRWKPCLHVVDGLPVRAGAFLEGAGPPGPSSPGP